MVETVQHGAAGASGPVLRRFELLPHCALTPREARRYFAAVAGTALAVAALFTVRGYWPVLPFAGVELALLGWALASNLRRRHDGQTIEVGEAEVVVTARGPGGPVRIQFSRHWAKVTLRGPRGSRTGRLLIESHGRACEIGAFLTEDERRALGQRLEALIGRTSDSPPLARTAGHDERPRA